MRESPTVCLFVRPEPAPAVPNPILVTVDTDPQDPEKPFIDCWPVNGQQGLYVYLVYTHDEQGVPRVFRTIQHWRASLLERAWVLKAKASVAWSRSLHGKDWELGEIDILDNKAR